MLSHPKKIRKFLFSDELIPIERYFCEKSSVREREGDEMDGHTHSTHRAYHTIKCDDQKRNGQKWQERQAASSRLPARLEIRVNPLDLFQR